MGFLLRDLKMIASKKHYISNEVGLLYHLFPGPYENPESVIVPLIRFNTIESLSPGDEHIVGDVILEEIVGQLEH